MISDFKLYEIKWFKILDNDNLNVANNYFMKYTLYRSASRLEIIDLSFT